jgi:hypothetical protein
MLERYVTLAMKTGHLLAWLSSNQEAERNTILIDSLSIPDQRGFDGSLFQKSGACLPRLETIIRAIRKTVKQGY